MIPDGLLFVGDFSGFLHCLDAETGKLYWTHDMKAHIWGSTLVADGKVYVGDEDGDFVVLAATKEKKIISTTNLGAADLFHAHRGQRRRSTSVRRRICYAFYDESKNPALKDQPAKIDINVNKAVTDS